MVETPRLQAKQSFAKSTSLMFVPNRDVATNAKGSCFQSASSRQTMNPSPCRRGSFSCNASLLDLVHVELQALLEDSASASGRPQRNRVVFIQLSFARAHADGKKSEQEV